MKVITSEFSSFISVPNKESNKDGKTRKKEKKFPSLACCTWKLGANVVWIFYSSII